MPGFAAPDFVADGQAMAGFAVANGFAGVPAEAGFAALDFETAEVVVAETAVDFAAIAACLDSAVAAGYLVAPGWAAEKVFPDGFVDRGGSASSAECFVLPYAHWTVPRAAPTNGAPSLDLLCSACRSHRQREARSCCKP